MKNRRKFTPIYDPVLGKGLRIEVKTPYGWSHFVGASSIGKCRREHPKAEFRMVNSKGEVVQV